MSNRWRTRWMIPLALLFSLSVAGCAQSPSSTAGQSTTAAAAVPAITAVPSPVSTAAPAATAAPSSGATASSTFTSLGLGLPRAKWEIHHEPDTGDQNTVFYDATDGNTRIVIGWWHERGQHRAVTNGWVFADLYGQHAQRFLRGGGML